MAQCRPSSEERRKGIDDSLVEGFTEDLLDERVLFVDIGGEHEPHVGDRLAVDDHSRAIVDGAKNDRLGLLLGRLIVNLEPIEPFGSSLIDRPTLARH